LAAKGLQRVDSETTGLYIDIQTAVNAEEEFTAYNRGWGYGPGWRGGDGDSTTTYGSTFEVFLEILQNRVKEPVMR